MNICFEGVKTGTICLGDGLAALHGSGLTIGHLGLGILVALAICISAFILHDPA